MMNQAALRWRLTRTVIDFRARHEHRSEPGVFPVRREWGGWAVRPIHGWRSVRVVTPPLAFTRQIPADDRDAALDWAMERLGIG
ncbi:hypothetical protein FEK33_17400 [Nocardia asteroides NBRC 15531]|uniref:Uncharacterized protein n=1 Tax=Nocardia asteroides NBRC 15531 TaxID=1110697 RepID=U5E3Z7_NOCAS|nr:hypothetical protein [Nocardia asteroides]TLF67687.1 hypothetical protein FEK33_17400 [Nocardia asteroides NBRC 15531]UGT50750.1 hypothetical protein LT345_09500 [Nocardia asteroides]SFN82035.1 hypothetical protein SAMN05444423_11528 [Nocardia asteroides]VEG36408.1 Uncharacterised protein [Nocardia asteroides]GAD83402.1 hypothetical protein NCAST_19_01040 [Nocardia asteroides NBRC 15531]